jgi:hypothetical protein
MLTPMTVLGLVIGCIPGRSQPAPAQGVPQQMDQYGPVLTLGGAIVTTIIAVFIFDLILSFTYVDRFRVNTPKLKRRAFLIILIFSAFMAALYIYFGKLDTIIGIF